MKKNSLLQLGLLFALTSTLSAQTFNTNVNVDSALNTPNLRVTGNGGVLFTPAGGNAAGTGAGTRLLWIPSKSAFRAGVVNGTQWDGANVGTSSAAFGVNNLVAAMGSFATGGDNVLSSGYWCSILGAANVLNNGSGTLIAGGSNSSLDQFCGLIAGNWNTATKSISVAIGEGNYSDGWGAMTIGRALNSKSAGCVVVGLSNTERVGNATYWVGTDPVFIVGNGTGNTAQSPTTVPVKSDALVVYKNGDIQIPKRQGDLLMGEFGNPND